MGKGDSEAKKKKPSAARKGLCCCLVVVLALILGLPQPLKQVVTDVLLIGYTAARYWHEGIPVSQAYKDVLYIATMTGGTLTFAKESAEMEGITRRQMLQVEPGDDHATALCKAAMYTSLVTMAVPEGVPPFMPPGYSNLDTFDPVPTIERIKSFVKACTEVYADMDKGSPQKKILDEWTPQIHEAFVTTPNNPVTSDPLREQARAERYTEAKARPAHSDRWKSTKDLGDYGFMYENTKIRPVKEEWIDASEIPEAIRQGKVAAFDATKLLGKEIFNKTMADIAVMHKDMAHQIPMYRQMGSMAPGKSGVESLELYGKKVGVWKQENSIRFPENSPWRPGGYHTPKDASDMMDGMKQPTWWLEVLATILDYTWLKWFFTDVRGYMRYMRQNVLQCAINTRRLPNLPMPKVEDALGNPDWLERAWTMFWLGPVADCWHYDDPDNLLIGVYGDIWVTVFKLKDRELMRANADRGCWSTVSTPMPQRIDTPWTEQFDSWLEKFEFIHLKLEPGIGVTVPSGAFHSLTMADGDRILMNCFMVPKYKGLWDAPAANYTFYNSRWQTEKYHAISQLKKSSIFRLWDTKKLGGFFEGTKLEML